MLQTPSAAASKYLTLVIYSRSRIEKILIRDDVNHVTIPHSGVWCPTWVIVRLYNREGFLSKSPSSRLALYWQLWHTWYGSHIHCLQSVEMKRKPFLSADSSKGILTLITVKYLFTYFFSSSSLYYFRIIGFDEILRRPVAFCGSFGAFCGNVRHLVAMVLNVRSTEYTPGHA